MNFNPIDDGTILTFPPPTLPPPGSAGPALNVLEIVPGLAVEVRYINDNWQLVPTSAPVDVEGMIVDKLAKKLQDPTTPTISYDEICCLLNALANRRDSQINAWRNAQGLLGTDKPLPLTEITPLAMVEDADRIPNTLPTAESSGNSIFDHIEYDYTCFQKGVFIDPVKFSVAQFGQGFDIFVIGDRLKVQLFHFGTEQPASPKFEIELKHRGPDNNGKCWPIDQWLIFSKSYPGGPDSTEWFSQMARHGIGAEYEGSCEHLGALESLGWPGGNTVALSIAVNREYAPGRFGTVANNKFYLVVEFVDKSKREYGVNLTMNYYNHDFGDLVTETRAYSQYYRDKALMQYVAAQEIKVLDQMRVDALINGPQWIQGKSILEGLAQAGPVCPPPEVPASIEWPPPPIELPPIIIPPLPPIQPPPPPEIEIPEIIIPPIPETPPLPIIEPIFPRKICEKDILEGRWI